MGLNPDTIHCICVDSVHLGKATFTDVVEFSLWVKALEALYGPILWVFHNGLNYDVEVINKLTPVTIDKSKVIDTFVVSRFLDYSKYRTHSLAEIGEKLGVYKGDYTGGWEVCTQEMIDYCVQDVEVLKAIFESFRLEIFNPSNRQALRMEHDFASVCKGMTKTGFPFNETSAISLLSSVQEEMNELEEGFKKFLSGKRVEARRIKLRYTKDGELYANCAKTLATMDAEIQGDEIVVYEKKEFNPGSPKQRVDVLWDYGWEPVDKTVGHIKHLRKRKRF